MSGQYNEEKITLTKPVFEKLQSLKVGRHCYNVYAKIVKATFSEITRQSGDIIKVCEGVLADSTGCANFRFEGDNAAIKEGQTVAIRNGRNEVVNEHIRLEVDKFGRVTQEEASQVGQVNTTFNLSEEAYVKKGRESEERERRDNKRDDRRDDRRDNRRDDDRDRREGARPQREREDRRR